MSARLSMAMVTKLPQVGKPGMLRCLQLSIIVYIISIVILLSVYRNVLT